MEMANLAVAYKDLISKRRERKRLVWDTEKGKTTVLNRITNEMQGTHVFRRDKLQNSVKDLDM